MALGPAAGQPAARLAFSPPAAGSLDSEPGALCAQLDGFSLHARVCVDAADRERLERLCRYVTRPAIASERLSLAEDGRVVYRLRHAWRDGTTHVLLEPLDFLGRLAALVPPRRAHGLTYHGVLAPASEWRDLIVPGAVGESRVGQPDRDRDGGCGDPGLLSPYAPPARPVNRYRWAELMRRVFGHDVLRCQRCGGRRRLIALISDPFIVRRILTHLGLPAQPPPIAPARAPPQGVFAF